MKYEHPWIWLEMALEAHNMAQKEFAELIGKSAVEVNQIINGKRNITLDRAMRISAVFDGEARHWIMMQAKYDEQEYQKSDKYPQLLKIKERVAIAFA